MNKIFTLTVFTLFAVSITFSAFAQEEIIAESPSADEFGFPKAEESEFSKAEDKPFFFMFSEGPAFSWLTRIIKQSGRSNFVFEDFLPGLYLRMDMHTIKNFTPMLRIAALYPLISTFNKIEQKPKTPLHIGADMNLGVNFSLLEFKYFRLNAGPAFHLFYLSSDRWNYFNLGAAAFVGMELPLTPRWTLICNGIASFDNGNFGGNRNMEPFDIVYQYQVDIGIRYSKKLINSASLFPGKKPALDASILSR